MFPRLVAYIFVGMQREAYLLSVAPLELPLPTRGGSVLEPPKVRRHPSSKRFSLRSKVVPFGGRLWVVFYGPRFRA